jgi:hypothetical protein
VSRVESAKDRAANKADPAQSDWRAGEILRFVYRKAYSTSRFESCGGSITGRRLDLSVAVVTYAVVPPSIRGQSRLALPGNQEPLFPRGIGSVGAKGVSWGRTAVVLGARESRVQGEGR